MKKLEVLIIIEPTKRAFTQFFTSIYDRLGLIKPFVVLLKCWFQKVCISKFNWDVILPPGIFKSMA